MKTGIILVAPLLLAPLASFAATFNYVDTSGTVRAVAANDASTALATAPNIASDSGVAVADGTISGSGGAVLGASTGPTGNYAYVDTAGVVRTVDASSASQALATAPNIASDSGVTVYDGVVTPNVPVNAQ